VPKKEVKSTYDSWFLFSIKL